LRTEETELSTFTSPKLLIVAAINEI
jgi:hypothetical protein